MHRNPLTNMAVAFHDEDHGAAAARCGVDLPPTATNVVMEAFWQYIQRVHLDKPLA
ncbi:MAG: hypothetical protein ACKV19_12245 [Verrucomicrobiales bacterium]